jgi:hypothetical protein
MSIILFNRHEIIDGTKYRDGEEFKTYKVPAFDSTITKEQLLQNIREYYFKRINEAGVTAPFKY